ncbi:MAG: hypothetical protein KA085_02275 [Phenylobacterium sp.]|uniref:hypothetical protein n=1 Tax=Phenylobacterium sp. TaxID=1871053 RepID=UPI001B740EA1|nr:hypothetical protein [Phenylobacterium sp.]MBP7814924.1 hypothetical protein [Phenylobacterium sp.]MBP9231136.1 hypothetical protein [Phenylobacterium sp.]MBP9753737.1 hypothetical protein [Phenylobacterium sp.]
MRPALLPLPVLALLSACTTAPADGSPEIQTRSEANRESVQGAVASPLRDVNVLRTKIPQVLLDAMADPYALPEPASCARITSMILPLNGALGADLDEPALDEDDLMVRGRGAALGAVASAASGLIPFRGWVRKLSGAERHDSLVSAAINAGAVRRAYLKGLGESRGCKPPARPAHDLVERPEPLPETLRPRYPIR